MAGGDAVLGAKGLDLSSVDVEEGNSVDIRRQSGKLKKEGSPQRPFVICTKFSNGIPAGYALK